MPPSLDDLLHDRYGPAAPSLTGEAHALLASQLQHRSVRAFTAQPLPPDALPLMLAAAQSASTTSNLQVWSVVTVDDPSVRERLFELSGKQRHVRECPLYLVFLADLARLDAIGAERELRREGLDYLEMLLAAVIDAALAAQNAVVAAEAMGLGVNYIGAMRNQPEAVAEVLGLPPRAFAVFGLCVGYPDPAQPAHVKPRLPQAAVLHRNRYDATAHREPVATYTQAMADFYRRENMRTNGDWAQHSLNRVRGPEALLGRDRIRHALAALGFPAL
ncbi:MAG TPA: NADPH-dependent oxidoreductase [Ramlibacter sp.]|nr:NADPH-dependent oxidoreductase [Ramlibacter sp.]